MIPEERAGEGARAWLRAVRWARPPATSQLGGGKRAARSPAWRAMGTATARQSASTLPTSRPASTSGRVARTPVHAYAAPFALHLRAAEAKKGMLRGDPDAINNGFFIVARSLDVRGPCWCVQEELGCVIEKSTYRGVQCAEY